MAAPPRIVTLNSAASAAATLLYLPDIALTDAAIKKQVQSLSQFTVKSLVVPPDDCTKFDGLASLVATTIELSEHPVILIGDSFGGTLALFVAHRCKSPRLSGIVLINPATSVELSNIPFIVPQLEALSRLPTPLATAAYNAPLPVALAATLSGSQPLLSLELSQLTSDALPLPTLLFRLSILREAATIVSRPSALSSLTLPVELLASTEDRLLPSVEEARRLARDLPNARIQLLRGSGHAPLLEEGSTRLDLADVLYKRSGGGLLARSKQSSKPYDYIRDFVRPPAETLANVSRSLDSIRRLASPVFLSTRDGQAIAGLGGLEEALQSGKPILLVGNHQLIGPDISLLVAEVFQGTGYLLRSLSHPSNFGVRTQERQTNGGPRISASAEAEEDGVRRRDIGAVPVTPRALYNLLAKGEPTLLYPGGLREAFKSTKKGEAYKLFWNESTSGSFARVAAKFNATIIPVAAIGADESFEMLLDADERLQLPYFGARAAEEARRTPVVLPDEKFVTPLSVPAPWRFRRFYFKLGSPIETGEVDAADREACAALYSRVKGELEGDLQYLLDRRRDDPYERFLPRAAVEASWNWTRQVPTFGL